MSPITMLHKRVVVMFGNKASQSQGLDVIKISLNPAFLSEWSRFKRSLLYLFQQGNFLTPSM